MFKRAAKIDIVHVPFKGSAPALADVLAGHIPIMFDTIRDHAPAAQSGKVRALAGDRIPSRAAGGRCPHDSRTWFSGYEVTSWQSLLAQPNAASDRRSSISGKRSGLKMPDVVERLATQGRQRARWQYAGGVRRCDQARDRQLFEDHTGSRIRLD
jgi:tripartite-type tricarboxylate transporter receptor subunit TctC